MLEVGTLQVSLPRREAYIEGELLKLTARQFNILTPLALEPGRIFSRQQLHNLVRTLEGEPPQAYDPVVDRALDVHVAALRSKGVTLIKSVRDVGYVLDDWDGPKYGK